MDSNASFEDLCSNPAFAMLMDNLGAGVVVYSADGRILFANSVRLEEPAAEHKVFVSAFGNA